LSAKLVVAHNSAHHPQSRIFFAELSKQMYRDMLIKV